MTRETPAAHLHHAERLKALEGLPYSFDLEKIDSYTEDAGWQIDRYEIELPPEPAGKPLTDGSFDRAKTILQGYKFPPSDLITGIYDPDIELGKRVMLLRAQFLLFTFWFGVRVTRLINERVEVETGNEYHWGYAYATLQGHFENGEISFRTVKHDHSGKVFFRIHAVSKPGEIKNPFYWLGFKLFGRGLQKRFANQSLVRVKAMVEASA